MVTFANIAELLKNVKPFLAVEQCAERVFVFNNLIIISKELTMKKNLWMGFLLGSLTVLMLNSSALADNVTRFNFVQPNFTGGPGNSFFDVAVVEERGGGEYLRNQAESLELSIMNSALDAERKAVGLENDKTVLEINKENLEAKQNGNDAGTQAVSAQSDEADGESDAQTVYNVENYYENVKDTKIENTGTLTYENYEDAVTKSIEAGEYNDVDVAYGTGDVEQNPTSNTLILIDP
jgi:hypothetical protein